MSGMVPATFHRDLRTCLSFPLREEQRGRSVQGVFTTAIPRNGHPMVPPSISQPTAMGIGSSSSVIPRFTDSIWQAARSSPSRIGTAPITDPVFPRRNHHRYLGYEDKVQAYQVPKLNLMDTDGSNKRELSVGLDRNLSPSIGPRTAKASTSKTRTRETPRSGTQTFRDGSLPWRRALEELT